MKFFRSKRDARLDQAISELRAEQPDAKTLSASAERVWQKLQAGLGEEAPGSQRQPIRGCADIRLMLPALHQQELSPARALIVEVWEEAQDVFARGSRLSVGQDSFLRLSMIQATNVVADICTFGYRVAGGTSLRKSVIQRLFRDIHAGTQHIICSTPMLRACGRDLLVTHFAS